MDAAGSWLAPNFRFPAALAAAQVYESMGRREDATRNYAAAYVAAARADQGRQPAGAQTRHRPGPGCSGAWPQRRGRRARPACRRAVARHHGCRRGAATSLPGGTGTRARRRSRGRVRDARADVQRRRLLQRAMGPARPRLRVAAPPAGIPGGARAMVTTARGRPARRDAPGRCASRRIKDAMS